MRKVNDLLAGPRFHVCVPPSAKFPVSPQHTITPENEHVTHSSLTNSNVQPSTWGVLPDRRGINPQRKRGSTVSQFAYLRRHPTLPTFTDCVQPGFFYASQPASEASPRVCTEHLGGATGYHSTTLVSSCILGRGGRERLPLRGAKYRSIGAVVSCYCHPQGHFRKYPPLFLRRFP